MTIEFDINESIRSIQV